MTRIINTNLEISENVADIRDTAGCVTPERKAFAARKSLMNKDKLAILMNFSMRATLCTGGGEA